jgi:hypothetical protein
MCWVHSVRSNTATSLHHPTPPLMPCASRVHVVLGSATGGHGCNTMRRTACGKKQWVAGRTPMHPRPMLRSGPAEVCRSAHSNARELQQQIHDEMFDGRRPRCLASLASSPGMAYPALPSTALQSTFPFRAPGAASCCSPSPPPEVVATLSPMSDEVSPSRVATTAVA